MQAKVYADFHNTDKHGRLRLACVGTQEDIKRQNIDLREGLALSFYADDLDDKGRTDELVVDGIVSFSDEEDCWVATIDWTAVRHASDAKVPLEGGAGVHELPVTPLPSPRSESSR